MTQQNFVFVDVGNSRIKFASVSADDLNTARSAPELWTIQSQTAEFFTLPETTPSTNWFICSVNQECCDGLVEKIQHQEQDSVHVFKQNQVPIVHDLETLETTGMDRLCAAVAANGLRISNHAAIVVDAGTAVTIDLIDVESVFQGGVIFPGLSTSFKSLRRDTSALPEIEITKSIDPEHLIGKNTVDAIKYGVYWSHLGAIESIVARMIAQIDSPVDVFVTGGAGESICQENPTWNWHPTLVLEGVAITAASL